MIYALQGGAAETLRTFWYAYDYSVRWPRGVDLTLGGSAMIVSLVALGGLVATLVQAARAKGQRGDRVYLGVALGVVALVQVTAVVLRFGLSDILGNHMGGAAQAKAFFAALVPLSITFVAGLAAAGNWLGWRDRQVALGIFCWVLMLDAVSLSFTLWHHYRWWQVSL
jgi:hypothetical protein